MLAVGEVAERAPDQIEVRAGGRVGSIVRTEHLVLLDFEKLLTE